MKKMDVIFMVEISVFLELDKILLGRKRGGEKSWLSESVGEK
jgi:hypothetical protein